jgi:hypothetical protein
VDVITGCAEKCSGEGTRLEVHMREWFLLLLVLVPAGTSVAQQTSVLEKSTESTTPKAVGPRTIDGCLSGNAKEGYFWGTDTGDLYQVIGSNSSLHRYAGQTVRIAGTVAYRKPAWSPSRELATLPPTLTVSNIKKVLGTCD